jgi:hypothetical protein
MTGIGAPVGSIGVPITGIGIIDEYALVVDGGLVSGGNGPEISPVGRCILAATQQENKRA